MLVNLGVEVFYPESSLVFFNSCFQYSAGLSNIYFITITTINLVNTIVFSSTFLLSFRWHNIFLSVLVGLLLNWILRGFKILLTRSDVSFDIGGRKVFSLYLVCWLIFAIILDIRLYFF